MYRTFLQFLSFRTLTRSREDALGFPALNSISAMEAVSVIKSKLAPMFTDSSMN
jgi:hypothetical protein